MMRRNKETGITPKESEGTIEKGDAYGPFAWLQSVDRWFDEIRREFDQTWSAWTGFTPLLARDGAVRQPAIDIRDDGKEVLVAAELPGVSKDDVEIHATPRGLEIRAESKGQREENREDYVYRERSSTSFYRRLPLPAEVVPEKVVATMKDGTLEVRLPKKEPAPAEKAVTVKVE